MIPFFDKGLCDYANCPSYHGVGGTVAGTVCCGKAHAIISNKACPKKQATLLEW